MAGKRERSGNDATELPVPKRQALERKGTIEIESIEGITQSVVRKGSSKVSILLDEIENSVSPQLSDACKMKLERKLSSIIATSTSFHAVRVSNTPNIPVENESNLFLPSEIWMEIFNHLPDAARWNLAKTCRRFLAIFENWVGFDAMMIYHTNELQSMQKTAISRNYKDEIEISSNFRFSAMPFPSNEVFDLKLCTGKTTNNWSYTKRRSITGGSFSIQIFAPVYKDQFEANPAEKEGRVIARIPLNIESPNNFFPEEFLPSSNLFYRLFGFKQIEPELPSQRFLFARWHVFPDKRCEFLFQLNSVGVKNALDQGEELSQYEKSAILMAVKQSALKSFRLTNWRRSRTSHNLPSCQPKGFIDINLHTYQLRALAWMKNIEQHAYKKKYFFSTLARVPGIQAFVNTILRREPSVFSRNTYVHLEGNNWLHDIEKKRLKERLPHRAWFSSHGNWEVTRSDTDDNSNYRDSFMAEGGVFADEMGLGKTISMISLILAHPRPTDASGNFENRHSDIETIFDTGSTLIVVPNQLVQQWKNEIELRTELKVLIFETITNVKKCSYETLLSYDIVVVPHALLVTNKQYKKRYTAAIPKSRKLSSTNVTFHHIGWHRIIIDEGHEILSESTKSGFMPLGKKIWKKYSSNYRWYVTGTPLPRGRASFTGLANFLNIKLDSGFEFEEDGEETCPFEFRVAEAFHRCLFWRNTKLAVAGQIEIPPLTESIELIQFSAVEQALYDAAVVLENQSEQRQICSFPLRAKMFPEAPQFLSDAPEVMIDHLRNQTESTIKRIPANKAKLQREKEDLEEATKDWNEAQIHPPERVLRKNYNNPEPYERYRAYLAKHKLYETLTDNVNHLQISIDRDEENLVSCFAQLACFTRLYPSESEDPCLLCKEVIQDKATTLCQHSFCAQCISAHVRQHNCCPVCKHPEHIEEIKFSNSNETLLQNELTNEQNWKNSIIQKYGSKMAAIASYLCELMKKSELVKVIVFSQYGDILSSVAKLLGEADPKHFDQIVECRGNIHIRKKQLELFNSNEPDSPRVLLLSLANSASGTHLAVATHIILVDPVVGSKEEAQATDAQAIARAHRLGQDKPVVAVRFIVENSIDQEDYEQTYGES